jgi:sulfur carrier protein
MNVILNGSPREIPDGTTVATLLEQLGLAARGVAVEVNYDVVSRQQHAEVRLRDGDRLEIVTFVGEG